MNEGFIPGKIEKKWQDFWQKQKLFLADDKSANKYYCLIEFPFLSGDGLHVGHLRSYTALDIVARKKRMEGRNVLFPIGFDSFGLPTENYAIKAKRKPQSITRENIANFTRQLKAMSFSFDWERSVDTSDPKYYKWTQWIFLQLYKAGLVYQKEMPINWCPSCKIGLANEEVVGGKCERCGSSVSKRNQKQWLFKITKYADRLIKDLDKVDFLEKIKKQQIDWIGRSEGANVKFEITNSPPTGDHPKGEKSQIQNLKLLIGTKNSAKKKRYVSFLKPLGIDVIGLDDLEKKIKVEVEEGKDIKENALKKARTYFEATKIPTIAIDEAFYIDKFSKEKQPGSQVRRIPSSNNKRPSDKELLNYYKKEIEKIGGESSAHWEFAIAFVNEEREEVKVFNNSNSKIVSKPSNAINKGYPLDSLQIDLKTGKYRSELSGKEEREALSEYVERVKEFVSHSLFSGSRISDRKSHVTNLEVFTTRPDTLYGVTYMVLSPEHELIAGCLPQIANRKEVEEYIKKAKTKSDLERTESKEKTGVELKGIKAINPVNNQEIPVWVADYVLTGYGTGAIMAVPGHDERDFEFAKKYKLPFINVIEPITGQPNKNEEFRQSIVALVKNPADGRLLSLNWGEKLGGNLFIGGGLEKGEDPIKCALREIEEETGYKNLKFIAQSEKIHHHYRAYSKGVNREIEATGIFFELVNEDKGDMDLKTDEKFKVEWLTLKEAERKVEDTLHHYVFEKFIKNKIYTGEGIMINSGQYNGMNSTKFKEVIIKELYSADGQKTNTCLVVHGISGHKCENWFPWLKEELNTIGWETIVPTMPGAGHPTLDLWNKYLSQYDQQINENSVLVGHSLGCAAILFHLQESEKKVDSVILVAPTNPQQKWPELKREYSDNDWEAVKDMNDTKNFNWKKIRKLAKRFVILYSDNDPYIPVKSIEYYRKNLSEAEFHLISGKYHFSERNGIKSLPEILPFIPENPSRAARPAVNYKLRDWIFSRQHYWGEPIPLIHCEKCGVIAVPEKDLPVELPDVENYEPTNTGESPLAKITEWLNVKCPKCGGKAKRETDTMPNWAGSNWYFIRYCDPHNDKEFASKKSIKHWLPVDLYNGGMEHTTLHLLYSRFWYKALYDLKLVPTDEPYQRRVSHGMVLAEDGQKMSKSRGNVINPDAVVKEFGADAVRLYEMFMGPFDQAINWSTDGLRGMKRFLDRIQKHFQTDFGTQDLETKKYALNKTVKKVTEDIDSLHFNTAVSALMKLINVYINLNNSNKEEREIFCKLLSPFAPHLAEELWEKLGHKESIFKEKWPSFDPKLVKDEEVEFIIQVNGKLRERLKLPADILENEAKEKALSSEKVKKYVIGKPKKIIFVKGRLINFVV